MTPIEKQILENQFVIMETLRNSTEDELMINNLEVAEAKTMSLLDFKESKEEDCVKMPERSCGKLFEQENDVGKTKCEGRTRCPECKKFAISKNEVKE